MVTDRRPYRRVVFALTVEVPDDYWWEPTQADADSLAGFLSQETEGLKVEGLLAPRVGRFAEDGEFLGFDTLAKGST